jgi:hypothetical protein
MSGREHGYAKYRLEGCRCYVCGFARSAYDENRNRAIAYGTWHPWVDAAPVRAHVESLRSCGLGLRRIAAVAGVQRGTLVGLMNGKPGRAPASKLRPATARRILNVQPTLDNLGGSTVIDAAGTVRRLRGLVAVGWSQSKLGARLGITPQNFTTLINAERVTARTARAVRALYDEMWDQVPPQGSHRLKISVSRARNHAAAHGWLPPAAWDDDLIDVPEAALAEELGRRVALMTDEELSGCHTSRYKYGDLSPLTVAGALEYGRRRKAREKARNAA